MTHLVKRHAARSSHPDYKHVAIIIKHGRIVAIRCNFGWKHAEERAIGSVSPELLKGATLYSYRLNRSGLPGNAKPCRYRPDGKKCCDDLIKESGIKWVVYTNSAGEEVRIRV